MNRQRLPASDIAVCYYGFSEFPPSTITQWTDGNPGQTAICPHCSVDAVVGFNGLVDVVWVQAAHKQGFG
jgi:hypothetical protein